MLDNQKRVPLIGGMALACLCILALAGCGGGGGSGGRSQAGLQPDGGPSQPPTEQPPDEQPPDEADPPIDTPPDEESPSQPGSRQYRAPGDYATINACNPIAGDANAPLKIVFLNINDSNFFDAVVQDALEQISDFAPFNDTRLRTAIYTVPIDDPALDCDANDFLDCDRALIEAALQDRCEVDELSGIIKVGVVESQYTSRGGKVIYLGVNDPDETVAMASLENAFVHELGHNFGLADLYGGWLYFDGKPSRQWPPELARSFLNTDGPGCPKWCNSFKPASEYRDSSTAVCTTFTTKQACITHNRDELGDCPVTDEDGNYDCCVWDDEGPFDYFGGQCAPFWGTENTGLDCLDGSGCYFGAVYGQDAWRPVLRGSDSLMYSTNASSFSSVELRELDTIIDCCLSASDADPWCEDFRIQYSDFLNDRNFKRRIGSCGVIPGEADGS